MEATYDGYHFCEFMEGVFNPFSVLNVFDGFKFSNYWFQTGTPTFLVEMLQKSEYDLRTLLNGIEAPASMFSEYRVEANNLIPLIYQSGYLTIKDYDKEFGNYLLQFPNDEVRYGFINFLVPFYTSMTNSDQGASSPKSKSKSAAGRADAIVKTPKYIYVFEFKLNGTAEEALRQIDDKGYLIPYQADGREVIKLGVEFSAETRNISRWL